MAKIKPIEHDELVTLYNSNTVVNHHLKKAKPQFSGEIHKEFDVDSVNKVAVMASTAFNLSGGSVGDIDLYKLLQAYILDPEKRAEINKISRGF